MEKNNSATRGFAILSIAGILNKILSVIYVPVLLQIIDGDLGYGIYNGGYQIYTFIYVLTNSGFPIAISKFQAELLANENYKTIRKSFKIIKLLMILFGLFMTVLTAVFAKQITQFIGYEKSYYVILALSPTLLFSSISCSHRGFFNGHSNMKPTAVSQVIEQFFNVLLSLLFAYLLKPYGVEIACAGATIGTTLGSLGSAIYLKNYFSKIRKSLYKKTPSDIKILSNKLIIKTILSYSIPIALNSIIIYGGNFIDLKITKQRLIISGYSETATYIKYGILSKYLQLLNVPLAITAAMQITMMPFVSSSIEKNDIKMLKYYINQAFKIALIVSIPATLGLSVLSKQIFILLFSTKYSDGWFLMSYGSIVILLTAIVQIQSGVLQAFNKTRVSSFSMIFGLIFKIVLDYFLIAVQAININGAVISTIICYIIAIYINYKYMDNYLPIRINTKKLIGRPFISSIIMAICAFISYRIFSFILKFILGAYLNNAFSSIISIIIAVIVYSLIMLKLGGITKDDLNSLPMSKKIIKFIPQKLLK